MSFTLREYQQTASDIATEFLSGRITNTAPGDRGLIVAPTAAGKSYIIADIASRCEKVLIFQPSKELLAQNIEKYRLTGEDASIYSASFGQKVISSTVFATIGSVKTKGHLFRGYKLIIDEAHLYPPKSSGMLGVFLRDSGIKKIVGLTATPFRLNSGRLKFITRTRPKIFGKVLHCIQIQDIVSRGFWSKLKYRPIQQDESMLKLNTNGTDYTDDSMRRYWEMNGIEQTVARIAKVVREHGRKSVLVFVPSVDEAHEMSRYIPGSRVVWGNMDKKERAEVVEGFKNLKIPVVINVNVLSVGFDHPMLDVIVCARPTRSLSWYYQAIGRGTRIHQSKKDCWVYDLTSNFQKFGRLENLTVEKHPKTGWEVFGTKTGKLLTNIHLSSDKPVTREDLTKHGRATYMWDAPLAWNA